LFAIVATLWWHSPWIESLSSWIGSVITIQRTPGAARRGGQ
jgi:hypothetical protein